MGASVQALRGGRRGRAETGQAGRARRAEKRERGWLSPPIPPSRAASHPSFTHPHADDRPEHAGRREAAARRAERAEAHRRERVPVEWITRAAGARVQEERNVEGADVDRDDGGACRERRRHQQRLGLGGGWAVRRRAWRPRRTHRPAQAARLRPGGCQLGRTWRRYRPHCRVQSQPDCHGFAFGAS